MTIPYFCSLLFYLNKMGFYIGIHSTFFSFLYDLTDKCIMLWLQPTLRQAAVETLRHLVERDSVSTSFISSRLHNMTYPEVWCKGYALTFNSLPVEEFVMDRLRLTSTLICAGFSGGRAYWGRSFRYVGLGNRWEVTQLHGCLLSPWYLDLSRLLLTLLTITF